MPLLSIENTTTSEIESLDITETLASAASYLQLDLSAALPVEPLTMDAPYQSYLDALAALVAGAQSRIAARTAQEQTPVMQSVEETLVGQFPGPEHGHVKSTTTDNDGNVVYVVESMKAVMPAPVSPEQLAGEEQAFAELATLQQFYQRGMSQNALLRKA